MEKMSSLLKQIGWSDELIEHFMIKDTEYEDRDELLFEQNVYDTKSVIITNSSASVGSNLVYKN